MNTGYHHKKRFTRSVASWREVY